MFISSLQSGLTSKPAKEFLYLQQSSEPLKALNPIHNKRNYSFCHRIFVPRNAEQQQHWDVSNPRDNMTPQSHPGTRITHFTTFQDFKDLEQMPASSQIFCPCSRSSWIVCCALRALRRLIGIRHRRLVDSVFL